MQYRGSWKALTPWPCELGLRFLQMRSPGTVDGLHERPSTQVLSVASQARRLPEPLALWYGVLGTYASTPK